MHPSHFGEPMIRLERLTKVFPGRHYPAVEELSLEVPEGEVVVLVGPSGCGKTTTMKLMNRLIEPTSGRIFLRGEDVTTAQPDRLRRRMGYVIQQIGLFPHMTIAANIATVPRLEGWDERRIRARVDDLLELVGMDPSEYRSRYPKELSGGQRQRVGVARALAADPPVMLMDEPFGAIDPITRDRLQNEFLRLQSEIRKTIVFVTHDIDEAIKMGDRIAILRDRAIVAQYDTPEHILSAPADRFVADFIGGGRSLKRLNLTRVRDIAPARWPTVDQEKAGEDAREVLRISGHRAVLVLDRHQRPIRWLTTRDVSRDPARDPAGEEHPLDEVGSPAEPVVGPETTLHDALDEMLASTQGCAIVVDGSGVYRGMVDLQTIMDVIQLTHAQDRARTGPAGDPEEVGA